MRVTETFNEIDWITIFFFIGLFVIVHGIDVAGRARPRGAAADGG